MAPDLVTQPVLHENFVDVKSDAGIIEPSPQFELLLLCKRVDTILIAFSSSGKRGAQTTKTKGHTIN